MVVKQHDAGGRGRRGLAKNLAWMRGTRIERTDRNDRRAQQPILRVEHHQPKLLDRPRAELRQQISGNLPRVVELHSKRRTSQECSPSEFHRSQHLGRLGDADAVETAQIVHADARNAVQAACGFQNLARQRQCVGSM